MAMKNLFKKPSSKDIYGYVEEQANTSFEQLTEKVTGKKAVQTSSPSKIELDSLVAEWNCFKMKMDSYLMSQRRK
jgi:hypothetical protein